MNPYLPILIIIGIAIALAAALAALATYAGPRHPNKRKEETYECGVPMVTQGRERMSVKFYMTAIMFILFDIETIFLFLWAKTFRQLGWFGVVEIMVFMVILVAGYYYVLKRGALEWE